MRSMRLSTPSVSTTLSWPPATEGQGLVPRPGIATWQASPPNLRSMGEVERRLHQRQREAAARQADERRAATEQDGAAQRPLIHEVEALIPAALAGLERSGWPGGQLLHVPRFMFAKQLAGWSARYFYHRHGEAGRSSRADLSAARWPLDGGRLHETRELLVRCVEPYLSTRPTLEPSPAPSAPPRSCRRPPPAR